MITPTPEGMAGDEGRRRSAVKPGNGPARAGSVSKRPARIGPAGDAGGKRGSGGWVGGGQATFSATTRVAESGVEWGQVAEKPEGGGSGGKLEKAEIRSEWRKGGEWWRVAESGRNLPETGRKWQKGTESDRKSRNVADSGGEWCKVPESAGKRRRVAESRGKSPENAKRVVASPARGHGLLRGRMVTHEFTDVVTSVVTHVVTGVVTDVVTGAISEAEGGHGSLRLAPRPP